MSSSKPTAASRIARFLPASRGWWMVGGAVLVGMLLFALVLSKKRDDFDFYRADGEGLPEVPGQAFEPLPAPLPAGGTDASGMDTRPPTAEESAAAARQSQPAAAAVPATQVPAAAAAAAPETGSREPRAVSAPAPDYPAAALRAGASGEVVLRIEVDDRGRPAEVSVVSSSRNRDLDRAALRAVRRWRFEPALRDGQPVPGTVQQSIRFDVPPP